MFSDDSQGEHLGERQASFHRRALMERTASSLLRTLNLHMQAERGGRGEGL